MVLLHGVQWETILRSVLRFVFHKLNPRHNGEKYFKLIINKNCVYSYEGVKNTLLELGLGVPLRYTVGY